MATRISVTSQSIPKILPRLQALTQEKRELNSRYRNLITKHINGMDPENIKATQRKIEMENRQIDQNFLAVLKSIQISNSPVVWV